MTTLYVYAAMLIHKGGQAINTERMNSVLKASGFEPDQTQVTDFVSRINDIDITYAVKAGAMMFTQPQAIVDNKPAEQVKAAEPEKNRDAEELDVFKNLFG